MVTKICVGDYVGDIYHQAKFYQNRFRGFGFAHAWFRSPWHEVTRLLFGSSWERLQPRRAHRFWRKIRQTTRFRARKCFFGVAKYYVISRVYGPWTLVNSLLFSPVSPPPTTVALVKSTTSVDAIRLECCDLEPENRLSPQTDCL